jgi:hypothetical protein
MSVINRVIDIGIEKKIPKEGHLMILTPFIYSITVLNLFDPDEVKTVTSKLLLRHSAYCLTIVSMPPISGWYILLTNNIFVSFNIII